MLGSAGRANINGPSLIRVPDWIDRPLGKYYLYFAAHGGRRIELAHADRLEGPWTVRSEGTLRLEQARACSGHIASPDVLVEEEARRIRMYFHGQAQAGQKTFVALSHDGLAFEADDTPLANFYLRAWRWGGMWYGLAKGGELFRSRDGLMPFEKGPMVLPGSFDPAWQFNRDAPRHVAVDLCGDELWVYWSTIGDRPEHILRGRMRLAGDWTQWKAADVQSVLKPETDYEGALLPLTVSRAGESRGPEHALRDPAIFREAGRTCLLYSVSGENGLAIAEIVEK
ncbi:MAG TPA: hypothetical protein DCX07_11415 [Phycisphaerales bacterium]|nr:hypothetical protein [Phycisphaerales bacterium]